MTRPSEVGHWMTEAKPDKLPLSPEKLKVVGPRMVGNSEVGEDHAAQNLDRDLFERVGEGQLAYHLRYGNNSEGGAMTALLPVESSGQALGNG